MPPNNFLGYSPQPQPFMQNFQVQQQNLNNNVIVVTVQGKSGAQIYPVAAGNTVFLADFNEGYFWIKSTDQNGMPQTFKEYKFEEVKPLENQGVTANFVTKEEFQQWQQGIDNQFKRLFGYLQNGGIKNESGNNAVVKQPSNVATKVE